MSYLKLHYSERQAESQVVHLCQFITDCGGGSGGRVVSLQFFHQDDVIPPSRRRPRRAEPLVQLSQLPLQLAAPRFSNLVHHCRALLLDLEGLFAAVEVQQPLLVLQASHGLGQVSDFLGVVRI